jgi:hypothetical protein
MAPAVPYQPDRGTTVAAIPTLLPFSLMLPHQLMRQPQLLKPSILTPSSAYDYLQRDLRRMSDEAKRSLMFYESDNTKLYYETMDYINGQFQGWIPLKPAEASVMDLLSLPATLTQIEEALLKALTNPLPY